MDDESSVGRALSRMLRSKVDEILVAVSPLEAEMLLDTQEVTHLICDHWFGRGQRLGVHLVRQWKETYPSIKRAVLLTGTDISLIEVQPDIDAILDKTVDEKAISRALGFND